MGALDVKVPTVGESVTEALLAQWFKNDGDLIRKDEALFVLETDKVTLEVTAEAAGVLHIRVPAGDDGQDRGRGGRDRHGGRGSRRAGAQTPPRARAAAAGRGGAVRCAAPAPASAPPPPAGPAAPDDGRFSPSVRRLAAEHRLDPGLIPGTGPGGRVTKGDVLLFLEQRDRAPAAAAAPPAAGAGLPALRRVDRGRRSPASP